MPKKDKQNTNVSQNRYSLAINKFAQMERDYALIRNAYHDKAIIYNYKESELCYIEASDLKNKADQLFLKYEIPLELNLLSKSWYEIDYDYTTDEQLEESGKLSDEEMHNGPVRKYV
ncbi:MAG: hypothetical protein AABY27_02080 [Pseudomonadota bacterium]